MAAKRNGRKIEPSVLRLSFTLSATDGTNKATDFLDLSQVASLVNRRFYRQGLNWAVAGLKFVGSNNAQIIVSKLPETWVMSNSWEKGFRNWQRMNNEALAENESVRPKFLDFKIYADSKHHEKGFAANLLPSVISAAGVPVVGQPGEWESSKFVIPRTDGTDQANSREVIAVGANYPGVSAVTGYNAVSLIEGYAASRALPNIIDPNTPGDMDSAAGGTPQNWMTALHNEGTVQDSAVLTDMETENNQAPYPFENGEIPGGGGATWTDTQYPNGANQLSGLQIHNLETVTGTSVGGITRMPGGQFPCGLIRIDVDAAEGTQFFMEIDLVPGNHRGYLAEPMLEM